MLEPTRSTPPRLLAPFALSIVLALAAALAIPSSALAGGVHVDPGGPAGKQYSDSLDQARAENGGGNPAAAIPGSTEEAPLFGEGVRADHAAVKEPSQEPADSTAPVSSAGGTGGSAAGLLGAVIAGVAAMGAIAGFGIRRLGRPPGA